MAPRHSPSPERASGARSRRSESPRNRHKDAAETKHRGRSRSPLQTNPRDSPERDSSVESGEAGQDAPPLPEEPVPEGPAPAQPPTERQLDSTLPTPQDANDDGWEAYFNDEHQAYWFWNRFTNISQWENPRLPQAPAAASASAPPKRTGAAGRYNPAIHGDYDPNADYAQVSDDEGDQHAPGLPASGDAAHHADDMTTTASFNRYTGAFHNAAAHPTHDPQAHTGEAQAYRQMSSYFDVDAAANQHGGRSLKEERRQHKPTRKEVQAYNAKRREKKKAKLDAFLRS